MAGITKDTPNGGKFVFDVDPESGEPSGTVREYAMGAVEQSLPTTDIARVADSLADVVVKFSKYGHTSIKVAEGERYWMEAATSLESSNGLNARLFPAWHWRTHSSAASAEEEANNIGGWEDISSALIYPRYVKIFYDGSPDSYTALLLEDYVDQPGNKGSSHLPKDEVLAAITTFNANGVGVLVHALGDGAAREIVDIFTQVREINGDNGVHLHLSHAMMMKPEDMARQAALTDTCVDFSPALGYPADEIAGSFVPPLGDDRYQQFFNVRAAFEAGLPVGFGSDWASSLIPEPDAFHYMQSWITRADPRGNSLDTVNSSQAVTLKQAIKGYTMGGAKCLGFGWDEKIGSIEEGKLADFIVLDRNVFEVAIDDLHNTKVDLTVMGGNVVYERDVDLAEQPHNKYSTETAPERPGMGTTIQ